MRTRDATMEDAPAIAAIYNDAIERTISSLWETPRPIEEIRDELSRASLRYPWLVAVADDGTIAGYALVKPWNPRHGYRHTVETTIYIHAEHRGRGVGRLLYDELFRLIREQGYRHVIAGISLPNEPSVRLHEAMGMERVAFFPGIGEKFGRSVDVGYWQISLKRDNDRDQA